jgi:hypothetical protein
MKEGAQVKSTEALEAFRASLIVYLSKARPALEEATDESRRTRDWLETDQRCHWERELRRRTAVLQEAEQELFSVRISTQGISPAAQQLAVARAREAVREAEDKLRLVRKWRREFANLTEPWVKQLDQIHGFLTTEMPRAVAFLTHAVRILDAYAEVSVKPAAEESSSGSALSAGSAPEISGPPVTSTPAKTPGESV